MADENNQNNELTEAQKLKYLEELVGKSMKQGGGNPPGASPGAASGDPSGDNTGGMSNDILAQILAELKALHSAANKPTQMQEMNPELSVYVNGKDTQLRYMTSYIKEAIDAHHMRLYLPPKAIGVMGFQQTIYPSIVLYMSMDEFNAKITGSFVVDLRKFCSPPLTPAEEAAKKLYGKVGNLQDDGTLYAGLSPVDGRAMFAEAADEGKGNMRFSFKGAKRRAKRMSRQTGADYFVPQEEEMKAMMRNLSKSPMGGFKYSVLMADSSYWTSTKKGIFNGIAVDYRGKKPTGFYGSRKRRYYVRLAHH